MFTIKEQINTENPFTKINQFHNTDLCLLIFRSNQL